MNNKRMLVLAMLLVGGYSQAAEIYNKDGNILDLTGSIRARHYFSHDTSVDGDNSYMRLGFLGETRINDQLTGYGRWETNIQLNNTEAEGTSNSKNRYGYAGIRWADYGSLDYGRNDGVLYDVTSITDFAPIFDILTDSYTDVFMTGRSTGLLTYRTHNFFGLTDKLKLAVQYQGKNGSGSNNDSRSVYYANGEGVGGSLSYNFDNDLSLLAAYENSNRTQQQNQLAYGKGQYANMWAMGLRYNPGSFYSALLYSQGQNITPLKGYGFANKTNNYEAFVRYTFSNGITPGIGWFESQGKDIGNYGNVTLAKYLDVSTAYYLDKNMSVYADYKVNFISKDAPMNISSSNAFGVGITYQF